jgi:XTP/dITP diphosphohydrolase
MKYPATLVVATNNRKKGVEMSQILADLPLKIMTLSDFPHIQSEVEETGATYKENAALKALAGVRETGLVCIADDAGLEIDALEGQPGLYSKRFLGEDRPFPEKMKRILELMKDMPDEGRGCRFRCSVVIASPDGEQVHCEGICEGKIAREIKGEYGFGYDPIFYIPELKKHMAELTPNEKHLISHRGKALACARVVLMRLFNEANN